MEPFRRQVRALTGRTALGGALLFAMAGVAAGLGGPAMPAAPAAQHTLRTAAAMEQPAALVYARTPRLQMDNAGRLRLTCELDNRGGSSATAVQMQVLAFNAKRQLVAGSSFSVYGLNIAPGGREVTSVLLPQLLTLTGRGKLRYVVAVTGGTAHGFGGGRQHCFSSSCMQRVSPTHFSPTASPPAPPANGIRAGRRCRRSSRSPLRAPTQARPNAEIEGLAA